MQTHESPFKKTLFFDRRKNLFFFNNSLYSTDLPKNKNIYINS